MQILDVNLRSRRHFLTEDWVLLRKKETDALRLEGGGNVKACLQGCASSVLPMTARDWDRSPCLQAKMPERLTVSVCRARTLICVAAAEVSNFFRKGGCFHRQPSSDHHARMFHTRASRFPSEYCVREDWFLLPQRQHGEFPHYA